MQRTSVDWKKWEQNEFKARIHNELLKIKWFYIYVLTLQLSFKAMFERCLGDHVWYKNEIWQVSNGVRRPSWALCSLVTSNCVEINGKYETIHVPSHKYEEFVHESQFRTVMHWRIFYNRFINRWNFHKSYWWDIWYQRQSLDKLTVVE